ncbi:MAG: hypothetical protein DSZ28_08310 [Thiothrix sp.]|nr:MAG: hypothetical protein DSZ28_08310 [Thiothrix sp.]
MARQAFTLSQIQTRTSRVFFNALLLMHFAFVVLGIFAPSLVLAKGEISNITTHLEAATPTTYADHAWGQGNNLLIDSFDFSGNTYETNTEADTVIIRRSSEATPCSLFAATTNASKSYQADFPGTGSRCDMATVMSGNIINRGALNVFSNTGGADKNIERIDFIFSNGITAPAVIADLAKTGHVATEKTGNNAIKIAAITAIDSTDTPARYGPLVMINPTGCPTNDICYGSPTNITSVDFLHSTSGDNPIYTASSVEGLSMAFVTLEDLGISAGQTYFGFSYFPPDVDDTIELTDISAFPTNTPRSTHGDADIYGGTAGYFILENLITSPVADDDTASTKPSQAVTINVLDGDAPLTGLTVTKIATEPGNGTATINSDSTITYTPNEGFEGADSFEYEAQNEAGAATASVTVAVEGLDFDNDGIADNRDIDDDNDGILDTEEGNEDFDNDGIANRLDIDADGDGINDLEESGLREPLQDILDTDSNGQIDASQAFGSNGLADALESMENQPDYSGNGKAETPIDTDADSHPDFLDLDSDNDGIHDIIEAGFTDPDHDGQQTDQPSINHPLDTDGGGIADYHDLDSDDDGLADIVEAGGVDTNGDALVDNFLDNDGNGHDDSLQSNTLPVPDTDGDGLADYRDLDSNNDGLPDLIEAGGEDHDLNGIVDNFNESSDLNNNGMASTLNSSTGGQALPDLDSDNDGLADRLEIDNDADGVMDIAEAGLSDSDSNNDGIIDDLNDANGDGFDDAARSTLLNLKALPDTDKNGEPDYREASTTPKLKTGVNGYGSGSADWLLLGLSLALLIWRRRLLAPVLTCFLLIPLSLQAENSPVEREFNGRWYLGANLAVTRLKPVTQAPWYGVADDSSNGYSISLGRDLTKHLSLEGYYFDLGEAQINLQNGTTKPLGYEHLGISALGYFYNNRSADDYKNGFDDEGLHRHEGFSTYARIGLGYMNNETNINYERVHSIHLHYGAGLEYGWSNGIAGRAEIIAHDKDAQTVSIGLLKRFGKVAMYKTPKPATKPKPVRTIQPTLSAPVLLVTPTLPIFVNLPVVNFKNNKWELTKQSLLNLNPLINSLIENPEWKIIIRGHTDAVGKEKSNYLLSKARATFVAQYLQYKGIQSKRIIILPFGEKLPIADNKTKEGRQLNRRVDFEIIK